MKKARIILKSRLFGIKTHKKIKEERFCVAIVGGFSFSFCFSFTFSFWLMMMIALVIHLGVSEATMWPPRFGFPATCSDINTSESWLISRRPHDHVPTFQSRIVHYNQSIYNNGLKKVFSLSYKYEQLYKDQLKMDNDLIRLLHHQMNSQFSAQLLFRGICRQPSLE